MVEEVLETGAEQVDDQDVMQALLAKVIDVGDARFCKSGKLSRELDLARRLTASNEDLVGPIFIAKLGSVALSRFLGLLE